jgi:hypothetical protein
MDYECVLVLLLGLGIGVRPRPQVTNPAVHLRRLLLKCCPRRLHPALILTSPSTATIDFDEAEPSPFYLAPDGCLLSPEYLREPADIDSDNDGSGPPMIIALALPLPHLAATAEVSASAEPQHKQKLAIIVEADEPSDTREPKMTMFVPSFLCSHGLSLTAFITS